MMNDNRDNIELITTQMKNSKEIIKKLCYNKAYEIYGKNLSIEVKNRLDLELTSIVNNNFETIYLIYSEIARYSHNLGYIVSYRGNIGDSFVAYLLGITNINPLYYNLPFEIFAGKDYNKEPEVELNISSKIQIKIFKYLQEILAKDKIVCEEANLNNIDKTNNFRSIWKFWSYKFIIWGQNNPTMIYELEKETNTNSNDIDVKDVETLQLFLHAKYTKGIIGYDTTFVKNILKIVKPLNFNDLVCTYALSHGTNTWSDNAYELIKNEGKKVDEVISNREDMYNYLLNNDIDKDLAYDIVEFVRMGKIFKGGNTRKLDKNINKDYNNKWNEYKKIMQEHNIPDWYIKSAEKIRYMFSKYHSIIHTMNAFKLAWYKAHYPEAFYKIYFKVISNLNIKDYYCKQQVKAELDELYNKAKKEDFDYVSEDAYKIEDLELVLEMYDRGILK